MLDRWVPLSPVSPTPVQPMDRLGAALGLAAGRLWVKRDDLTGLGGGGNKVRKLEHLCADALAQGCDVLVTGGGRQSNHARITAAAANQLGLDCTLVLGSDPVDVATGNVVLDQLLGADLVWAGPLDYYPLEAAIEAEADRQRDAGPAPVRHPARRGVDDRPARLRAGGPASSASSSRTRPSSPPPTAPAAPTPGSSPGGATTTRCSAWTSAPGPTSTRWSPARRPPRPRWPTSRAHRARAPSTTTASATATAPRRRAAARPSTCAPASRACSSTPCTPARAWPASSPASATAGAPTEGTIVFVHTGGLPGAAHPALHRLGGRVAVMHPADEVRATVDAYVALRARIEAGDATWIDLADFFTDDAVYIDPAWGRIQGIEEIRAFLVDSMRGLEDWRFPIRFTAIDGDDVVTVWDQVLPGPARRRPAVPADRRLDAPLRGRREVLVRGGPPEHGPRARGPRRERLATGPGLHRPARQPRSAPDARGTVPPCAPGAGGGWT